PVRQPRLRRLSRRAGARACAGARRPPGPNRGARRREHARRRRKLHPPRDRRSFRRDREGLRAAHAGVPRPPARGRADAARRVREVAEAGRRGIGPMSANYLSASYSVRSWLLTTDHKRIAILYLLAITFF